ncbi:MAG: hypothetical protein WAP35_11180 [Solirubrobacterales bacterium]
MSISASTKIRIVLLGAILAIGFAGCGDDEKQPDSAATAPTADGRSATRSTGAVVSPETGATDDSGVTPEDGAVVPGEADARGGAGDEEAARTPVDISISDGRFGRDTPKVVHVPSFIAVEVIAVVKGDRDQIITVKRDGKSTRYTLSPGRQAIMLEGLRPKRSLEVRLGADKVVVTADAEPGP